MRSVAPMLTSQGSDTSIVVKDDRPDFYVVREGEGKGHQSNFLFSHSRGMAVAQGSVL